MLLRLAIKAVTLLSIFRGVRTTPTVEKIAGPLESPLAISAEDSIIDQHAILKPVPSCLSGVILVIYVQSLPLLERIDVYKDMYGPFFAEIHFYVDGTWCDPRALGRDAYVPCYGPPLNRSTLPEEVHVLDHTGGGWFMQRPLIDVIQRSRGKVDPAGFLIIADDVLLNLGKLTREVKCNVIWRAGPGLCQDVGSGRKYRGVIRRLFLEARAFFEFSEEGFREQLARNLGSPSMCCMGEQPDFLYIPSGMTKAWTTIAQQMTEFGLTFPFTFNTAIYGIAPKEDMFFLQTHYLDARDRADNLLKGAAFEGKNQPYCWTGKGDVNKLLDMHIIHPHKIAYSNKSLDFARTLNQPLAAVNISGANVVSFDGGTPVVEKPTNSFYFWCGKH